MKSCPAGARAVLHLLVGGMCVARALLPGSVMRWGRELGVFVLMGGFGTCQQGKTFVPACGV
jgi:hypothetical protein